MNSKYIITTSEEMASGNNVWFDVSLHNACEFAGRIQHAHPTAIVCVLDTSDGTLDDWKKRVNYKS